MISHPVPHTSLGVFYLLLLFRIHLGVETCFLHLEYSFVLDYVGVEIGFDNNLPKLQLRSILWYICRCAINKKAQAYTYETSFKNKRHISSVKDKVTTLLYEKVQWKLKIIFFFGICKTKKKKRKYMHIQATRINSGKDFYNLILEIICSF